MYRDSTEEPKLRCHVDVRREKRDDCPEDLNLSPDKRMACRSLYRLKALAARMQDDLPKSKSWLDQIYYRTADLAEELEQGRVRCAGQVLARIRRAAGQAARTATRKSGKTRLRRAVTQVVQDIERLI